MYNGIYDVEQFAYMHDVQQKWLKRKVIDKESLADVLLNKGITQIAIYGLGDIGKLVYEDVASSEIQVTAFIDKKLGEAGGFWKSIPIIGIGNIGQIGDKTFILITPEFYFVEIIEDLQKAKFPLKRVISLSMLV